MQDPSEIEFNDMPQSAIAHVTPDHIVKLGTIGSILQELAEPTSSFEINPNERRLI